jgi:hypothetical protein
MLNMESVGEDAAAEAACDDVDVERIGTEAAGFGSEYGI